MRSSELPSLDELSQMRQKLNRIEEQIRSSQREFSNSTLISNPNKSGFRITINIEDSPGKEPKNTLSSISKPHSSAAIHSVSPERKFYSGQDTSQFEEIGKDRRGLNETIAEQILEGSRFRSQKRFSSPNNNPISFEYSSRLIGGDQKPKEQVKHAQIFIKDDESEIQSEALSIPLSHLRGKTIDKFSEGGQLVQEESTINLPSSTQKGNKTLEDTPEALQNSKDRSVSQSPVVYSYIHQRPQTQHPEVNTPYNEGRPFQIQQSASIKPNSSSPKPKGGSFTKKLRVQEIEDKINSKIVSTHKGAQESRINRINNFTNKITNEQKTFKKSTSIDRYHNNGNREQRSSSEAARNPHPQRKYLNAEKLVRERKQIKIFPPNITGRSKSKQDSSRYNNFLGRKKQRSHSKSSEKYALSPKLSEITDRLHRSKQKQSPCSYYSKYNQSSERQRFNLMVEQNPFVARYVCVSEREELFQKLRSSSDSISLWPMKIVSYTYSKLQRSLSAVQSLVE